MLTKHSFAHAQPNFLAVLPWLLGAVFLACVIVAGAWSPKWQPQIAALEMNREKRDAFRKVMAPLYPPVTPSSHFTKATGPGEANARPAHEESPSNLYAVDLTIAPPYGNPASGPVNWGHRKQASDAPLPREIALIKDTGLVSRSPRGEQVALVTNARARDVNRERAGDSPGVAGNPVAITGTPGVRQANPGPGPWVIYLASLRRESDVSAFITRLQSRGVTAMSSRAKVDGKDYWRVFVPGFATASQAKTSASQIKERLGLDDYWVAQR